MLEHTVIDAMERRLPLPERLRELLANMLDDSSAAVRERQVYLKALRTERTRIDAAIQNMLDFIEQASSRRAMPTSRLGLPRIGRVALISCRRLRWLSASFLQPTGGSRQKRSTDWGR